MASELSKYLGWLGWKCLYNITIRGRRAPTLSKWCKASPLPYGNRLIGLFCKQIQLFKARLQDSHGYKIGCFSPLVSASFCEKRAHLRLPLTWKVRWFSLGSWLMATMGIVTIQCQGESCLNFRSNSIACGWLSRNWKEHVWGTFWGDSDFIPPQMCCLSLSGVSEPCTSARPSDPPVLGPLWGGFGDHSRRERLGGLKKSLTWGTRWVTCCHIQNKVIHGSNLSVHRHKNG